MSVINHIPRWKNYLASNNGAAKLHGRSGLKYSCARALASVLLVLKSAAVRSGGDAVINIKSNYKHRELSSESHFQCATGILMSGVA